MKHISILAAFCLLFLCTACSAEETPPVSDNATTVATTVATTSETAVLTTTTEATTAESTTKTEGETIILTTENTTITTTRSLLPTMIPDGREFGAEGTTKDGFGWRRYQSLYFSAPSADYQKLKEHLDDNFGNDRSVVILGYRSATPHRAIIPETIEGFPVVSIRATSYNKAVKEVVLHKYIIVYKRSAFPNVTDVYMPEEFISGQLPYGMDEWPAMGITYHIPAASPLAAQLREKLTAAGVSHALLTEGAVGVLDLSEVDLIEADGKLLFE